MVLKNIEKPMLEVVLAKAGNQTLAAEMLGINRNTLRETDRTPVVVRIELLAVS
jgi:DNA-binding protein Fis